MPVHATQSGAVAVFTLDGDALGGPDGTQLHEGVRALPAPAHAVVDLGGVRHMNSSGLGMLLGALATVRDGGGDLRLAAVPPRVATLLQVTRLDGTFLQFATAADAVASFSGGMGD
jgi:anti-sigma B factor antagonist